MNFLAIDTSSNACSVAAQSDDRIQSRHVVEARAHTQILVPMVCGVLEELKLRVEDLDAVILGNGPGSFIGVRIGASLAQGLCFGVGLKIVPISSLAVVAAEVFASSDLSEVAIAQDARMDEVYFGHFKRGATDEPVLVGDERIVSTANVSASIDVTAVAGDAWNRYPKLIDGHDNGLVEKLPVLTPNAAYLLPLGVAAYLQGLAVEAVDLNPAYLRMKVADEPATNEQENESG